MNELACIILAAGKGTRMKSSKPKALHEIAGRPMIHWLIESAENLGASKIIVVVGPDMPDLEEAIKPHTAAIQTEQKGTGDAVKAAMLHLEGFQGKVLILMGDEPLVPIQALEELKQSHASMALMGIVPDNPFGLGRLVLDDDGHLLKIVEEKDAHESEKEIDLCNGGNYCVEATLLRASLQEITNDNAQSEYYLTDIVTVARDSGISCEVVELAVNHVWGINNRAQLAEHEHVVQRRLRDKHMAAGVSLSDPDTVYFSWDTEIGQDVTIGPGVFFGPGVQVADNVEILPYCHLEGVCIESGATIGPFARLRPGTVLEENVKIGNFVEVKKSRISKGSKASHLTYIGDGEVGEKCNIGAGTIFCNYDGTSKYKTVLEDGVFIGSNSTLVSPVNIASGAYIGAGSVITKDVSKDSLALSRTRQTEIKSWASKRREKLKK